MMLSIDEDRDQTAVFDIDAVARAAIEALREPTEVMKRAGDERADFRVSEWVWEDMIDAALRD